MGRTATSFPKELLKFMVACIGPGSVLFHIHLFETYFGLGKPSPGGIHKVRLDNHGAYRYITESQSHNLDISLGVSLMMLAVFFGMVIARVRASKASV